jgi:hypothetical protein
VTIELWVEHFVLQSNSLTANTFSAKLLCELLAQAANTGLSEMCSPRTAGDFLLVQ